MLQIEDLRSVPLLSQLSPEELQWLHESGTEVSFAAGEVIAEQGSAPDGFYIVLEGQTEWMQQVTSERRAHAVTLGVGEIFAELLLILNKPFPVTGKAITAVRLCKLAPAIFWELLHRRPDVMRSVVSVATNRSQMHEAVGQQQAKLISLGTMAAGLAHEMNNPAAAIQRSSQSLSEILKTFSVRSLKLNRWHLMPEQQQTLEKMLAATASPPEESVSLDPLIQSDLEDKVSDWLETQNIEGAWELAPSFVEAGLLVDQLDQVVQSIPREALTDALKWLESAVASQKLLEQIQEGSARLSEVVGSIKRYSYMDSASLQEIDISEGIKDTLAIMSYKLKEERVRVSLDLDPSTPKICAYGADLNQVWTNLIDNAIDALREKAPPDPEIQIRINEELDWIVVEIADNGVGISPNVESRLFEPFFTTKGVGKGTGLGLDICRRIVEGQHKGSIRVESTPGRTQFDIRIPSNMRAN